MCYRTGGLAVAVPGELMGYWEAYKKYGRLPWPELFEPAIKLCKIGSRINDYLAAYLAEKEPMIKNESSLAEILINPATNKTWIVSNTLLFALSRGAPYYFQNLSLCLAKRQSYEINRGIFTGGRPDKEIETSGDVEVDSGRGSRNILQWQSY